MRKFRIVDNVTPEGLFPEFVSFHVQMKILWFWVTIKTFTDEDPVFAYGLAEELLDKLNEE